MPKGYAAVDPNDIVPGHPGFPVNLRRLDDDVTFVFVRDRVYIPEGYEPESLQDLLGADGWPLAIIRKQDKVRFVRIEGAVYRRGDPRSRAGRRLAGQSDDVPLRARAAASTSRSRRSPSARSKGYVKDHQDDPGLKEWKDWLKKFRVDHPDPNEVSGRMP